MLVNIWYVNNFFLKVSVTLDLHSVFGGYVLSNLCVREPHH